MRFQQWFSRLVAAASLITAAVGSPSALAESGDLVWRRDIPRSFDCPMPVISSGLAVTYSQDYDKSFSDLVLRLRAFDTTTGKRKWRAWVRDGEWDPVSVLGPGITEAGNRVFVAYEYRGRWKEISGIAEVAAYDAGSGENLWTRHLEGGRSLYRVNAIAATADVVVVVGSRSGWSEARGSRSEVMVLALEAATGRTLWSNFFSREGKYDDGWGVAVGRGRAVVLGNMRNKQGATVAVVRAYEASTGRLNWEDVTTAGTPHRVALDRNRVYTMGWTTNRRHSFLMAHDLATGRKLWQRRVPKILGLSLNAGRRAVVVSGREASWIPVRSRLRVYDGESGELLWRRNLVEDEEIGQVLTHRDRLYTIGWPGFLVEAYGIRSGRLIWSRREVDEEDGEYGCALAHTGSLLMATSDRSPAAYIRAFEP